jgi:polyhydroxyalkanoate synthesis regulator phasin
VDLFSSASLKAFQGYQKTHGKTFFMKHLPAHEYALLCSKEYKTSEAKLLDAIQKVDAAQDWIKLGYPSLHVYIVQELKLTDDLAYNYSRVARKANEVPKLKEAVESGELNVNQARRIASVISEENQDEWIEKAIHLKQRDLDKEIVKAKPQEARPDKIKPIAQKASELRCVLPEEVEKLLERVKDLESKRLARPVTLAEALKASFEIYLERKDPVQKAERAKLRLEAKRVPIRKKLPAWVTPRAIPKHVVHEVNLRDRGECSYKDKAGRKCGSTKFTEVHHITPWSFGGKHEPENLITLCSGHHKALHFKERVYRSASIS